MNITKSTSTIHTQALAKRAISYIVIHYTAGVTSRAGSAANTANYYKIADRNVSSDYTVDDAGAVLYNPDIRNRYTWHCGGSKYNNKGGSLYGKCKNSNSIGIEVCSTNSTGKMQSANDNTYSFTSATVANAVELTKQLMRDYGIDATHVVRHYDVTGKLCPGIKGWNAESGSESAWNDFKSRISGASSIPTTAPTTSAQIYRIRKSWADSKSQIGAYSSLSGAKKACKSGYTVFDASGNAVYTMQSAQDATHGIASTSRIVAGAKIQLDKMQLFASATTSTVANALTGFYYVTDGKIISGRFRISAKQGGAVTGWIDAKYTNQTG